MITSLTSAGSSLARCSAQLITIEPRSTAGIFASEPPNFPTAVRTADTITMSLMNYFPLSALRRNGGSVAYCAGRLHATRTRASGYFKKPRL